MLQRLTRYHSGHCGSFRCGSYSNTLSRFTLVFTSCCSIHRTCKTTKTNIHCHKNLLFIFFSLIKLYNLSKKYNKSTADCWLCVAQVGISLPAKTGPSLCFRHDCLKRVQHTGHLWPKGMFHSWPDWILEYQLLGCGLSHRPVEPWSLDWISSISWHSNTGASLHDRKGCFTSPACADDVLKGWMLWSRIGW